MSIVITGASGQLGRLSAELVLDRVPASEVILTTRRPEVLSDLAERRATVRQADFDRPETLAEAFAGGENLLLISTDDLGRRAAQHRAAIEAAREAGVRHVAYTSYLNPVEQNPAVITPSHRDTEWALRESGLAWSALRHAFYAEYRRAGDRHGPAHPQQWGRENRLRLTRGLRRGGRRGPYHRRPRGQSLRHHRAGIF
jgi:NAD(P)H dehydrogenase (quinone)